MPIFSLILLLLALQDVKAMRVIISLLTTSVCATAPLLPLVLLEKTSLQIVVVYVQTLISVTELPEEILPLTARALAAPAPLLKSSTLLIALAPAPPLTAVSEPCYLLPMPIALATAQVSLLVV